jgi:hypothetical protein
MIILKKVKITWNDTDTTFNTFITLNHAGNEYKARVRGFSYRNTCEMQVKKNGAVLFTVPFILNTMSETVNVAKMTLIGLASRETA